MNLDLDDLTADWECPQEEINARAIIGRDGAELLQMRVDLGLLQMFPDDRPDGTRYHGMPSVLEFVVHETRAGREIGVEDWAALERELFQINYRRIALASLAESALREKDEAAARRHLRRVLRDIGAALESIQVMQERRAAGDNHSALRPTLLLNRARLAAQLAVVEARYEEAIERAEAGARELEELFSEVGTDSDGLEQDPGVTYLRRLGRDLRDQYGIRLTLQEQLQEAIENEDFKAAAELRDELEQRRRAQPPAPRTAPDP